MARILYFSYGSNMSSKRLQQRVPSASFVSTATLFEHDLRFHKKSHDGSAKCDAFQTGSPEDNVIGTLFRINQNEKFKLDEVEGLGYGYDIKHVQVLLPSGITQEAFTYFATDIDEILRPYHWYHYHVVTGAREYLLPAEYIDKIVKVKTIDDPDKQREKKETEIYKK